MPLSLRNVELNLQLLDFLDTIDLLRSKLGEKPSLNASFFKIGIKLVHEVIRKKLKQLKYNKINTVLRSVFYELMPLTEGQRRQLPSIFVELSSE